MINLWNDITSPYSLGEIEERVSVSLGIPTSRISTNELAQYSVSKISGIMPPGLLVTSNINSSNIIYGMADEVTQSTMYDFVLRASLDITIHPYILDGQSCFSCDIDLDGNQVSTTINGVSRRVYAYKISPGVFCLRESMAPTSNILDLSGETNILLVSDKSFRLVVNGADAPNWLTKSGLLKVSPDGQVFIPYGYPVEFQLKAYDTDTVNGISLSYVIHSGELPPGLTLSSSGLITGVIVTPPIDSPTTYKFIVNCTDGDINSLRNFSIYCIPGRYLRSSNRYQDLDYMADISNNANEDMIVGNIYTSDCSYLRPPFWISDEYIGTFPFGSSVRTAISVYDYNPSVGELGFFVDKLIVTAEGFITDNLKLSMIYGTVSIGDKFYKETSAGRGSTIYTVTNITSSGTLSSSPSFTKEPGMRLVFGGDNSNLSCNISQNGIIEMQSPALPGLVSVTFGAFKRDTSKINYKAVVLKVKSFNANQITSYLPSNLVPTSIIGLTITNGVNTKTIIREDNRDGDWITFSTSSFFDNLNVGDILNINIPMEDDYLTSYVISRQTYKVVFSKQHYGYFEWLTNSDLGEIKSDIPSRISITANPPANTILRYYTGTTNNKLRNGIYIDSITGDLEGVFSFENGNLFSIDTEKTTFDGGSTTIDNILTFDVTANALQSGVVTDSISRTFYLKIDYDASRLSKLHILPMIPTSELDIYTSIVNNIPTEYLYRPRDPNFGKVPSINILLHPGVSAMTYSTLQALVADTDYIRLRFDHYDVISVGEYEVLYARMYDTRELADTFNSNQAYSSFHQLLRSIDVYIESHENLEYDYSIIPEWLRMINLTESAYQTVIAFPIAFCKNGKGAIVKNILENDTNLRMNRISFVCDRISASSILVGTRVSKNITHIPFGGRSGNYYTEQY